MASHVCKTATSAVACGVQVVLRPDRLSRSVVCITLDMSSPGEAFQTLLFWLQALPHCSSAERCATSGWMLKWGVACAPWQKEAIG